MATALHNRFAAVAGALVLAVALLVLGAGAAQARPSLPQLIKHHSGFATLAFGGRTAASTTGAAVPLVGGRSIAAGHGPVAFQRGRFVPVASAASTTGIYVGLGAVLVVLAGLATGLIVSERRSRNVAAASTGSQTVSPMPEGRPAAPAGGEGSQEQHRRAA